MSKIDNDDLIQEYMKPLAKERKAKCTYTCIYKKEGAYFWRIKIIPYIKGQYTIFVNIKLWQYDEFLTSITHPDNPQRFTDKRRHQGFFAMVPYQICRRDIDAPIDPVTNVADVNQLKNWCEDVYQDAISRIDSFVRLVENDYQGLNNFLIANAVNDPLMAAFALIYNAEYSKATEMLEKSQEKQLKFERSFGTVSRDLRDVLLDFCNVRLDGREWTRDMVLGGI